MVDLNSNEQGNDDSSASSNEKMNNNPERREGTRSLWEVTLLGVSLVVGNHLHYWNVGIVDGMVDYLIAAIVGGASYLCLLLCLAEMTSALPFGGGLYGIARLTMGPYVGFLMACCEMLQSIIFTATLIYPAGDDLAMLFGLSRWYALPFWVFLLALALLVNVVEVKYFWRSNVVLVGVVVILFCVYYAVSMPCMDCDRYGGGLLEGKVSATNWFKYYLFSAMFYDGLILLPMACSDASQPKKTVPRSFLWSFGIAAVSAVLLIITVGCNAPGVAYYAIPETNALFYGYAKGLHIDHRVARVLSIPGLFATASAFTYVYGIQLRSMAQSGLFPTVINYSYGPDETPYVALLVGAGLVLVCVCISHAIGIEVLWTLFILGHMAGGAVDFIVLISYWQLQRRFSSLQRSFTQPFGMYAVYFSFTFYLSAFVSFFIFYPQYYTAAWVFVIYIVALWVWYFSQVRSAQKFSTKEQEVMFQAYVINANFFRRKNKRHNLQPTSSPNTTNLSPSPSKSHMLSRSAAILSRVAACVSQMCRVRTGCNRSCKEVNLLTDELVDKNEGCCIEDYSSTVTGESRFLQSHRLECHVSTVPIHKKSSLFSLSSDLLDCDVRRHPASGYDKKGHQNGSSAKYRIAPDYEFEVGLGMFPS